MATLLGATPKTIPSSLLVLFTSFAVSAVIHCVGGDYMLTGTILQISAKFFLLQPLVITLESVVLNLLGSADRLPSWMTRTLGYIWVAAWFSWCTVEMVDGLVGAGLSDGELLPYSILRRRWVV